MPIKSQPISETNPREFQKPKTPPRRVTASNPFGLTKRQLLFVDEYMKEPGISYREAARRAGYSEKCLSTAHTIVHSEWVEKAINARRKDAAKAAGVTVDKVVGELARIAFGDVSKFIKVTELGDLYWDYTDATPEELRMIEELTVDHYVEGKGRNAITVKKTKIKKPDQLRALEMLMRHLGAFNDKLKLEGTADVVGRLQAGRKRVRQP